MFDGQAAGDEARDAPGDRLRQFVLYDIFTEPFGAGAQLSGAIARKLIVELKDLSIRIAIPKIPPETRQTGDDVVSAVQKGEVGCGLRHELSPSRQLFGAVGVELPLDLPLILTSSRRAV